MRCGGVGRMVGVRWASRSSGNALKKSAMRPQKMDVAGENKKAQENDQHNLFPLTSTASTSLASSDLPTTTLGRMLHYGSLAAGLGFQAVTASLRQGAKNQEGPSWLKRDGLELLVNKLSVMRGAALKIGQFLSIQDSQLIPRELQDVLNKVQAAANYMPEWQLRQVMCQELGPDWTKSFESFDFRPVAAASIGQVHRARFQGKEVAVKVQYPDIHNAIMSDLKALKMLALVGDLLPKGLFLDNTISVFEQELADECDYHREAEMCDEFGRLLGREFVVPRVYREVSSGKVLTMDWIEGRPLAKVLDELDQETRDRIAKEMLTLCIREIFEFRLMQTDPNWSNFLLTENGKIGLIDFGATRRYSESFVEKYKKVIVAAMSGKKDDCIRFSQEIGYLTGEEKADMVDAHVQAMVSLGSPFADSAPDVYDFGQEKITDAVKGNIPLMLRERKTPPPRETYSLNRKLSGCFLLCTRLKARVRCKEIWRKTMT